MGQTLRHYWTDAPGYQKLLYVVGTVLLMSGMFHLGVILVTGGSWQGPVSWRKPITFGFSFAVTCWALGWILSYLPSRQRIGWTLSGGFSVAAVSEVFLISMQQWRGVASHFNFATPFDDMIFTIMGNLVTVIAVIVLVLTVWTFVSLQAPASLALAIRLGMVLLLAGQLTGALIILFGTPQVLMGTAQVAGHVTREPNIYGVAGVMKLPHALTLHGIQVLGVLAWVLLFTTWKERVRVTIVTIGSIGFVGLVLAMLVQTYSGLAPFELSLPLALLLAGSACSLVAAYAAAAVAVWQTLFPLPTHE
jgi:hypothetical protein